MAVSFQAMDGDFSDVLDVDHRSGKYYWKELGNYIIAIDSVGMVPFYDKSSVLTFSAEDVSHRACILYGFSGAENGFTWLEGKEAAVAIGLSGADNCSRISMEMAIVSAINDHQRMEIYVNSELVYQTEQAVAGTVTVNFPKRADGIYRIQILMPDATTTETDSRELSVRIASMAFKGVS